MGAKKKVQEKKAKTVLKEKTAKKSEAQSKAGEREGKETRSKEKAKKAMERRKKAEAQEEKGSKGLEKRKKNKAKESSTKKATECKPADVKGEEFYSWSGKYCYHIVAGSVLEQGRWHGQGRKSLCNKKGFKKTVVIGRGKG